MARTWAVVTPPSNGTPTRPMSTSSSRPLWGEAEEGRDSAIARLQLRIGQFQIALNLLDHDFSRRDFSRCLRANVVGNRRGQKTPRISRRSFFGCLLRTHRKIAGKNRRTLSHEMVAGQCVMPVTHHCCTLEYVCGAVALARYRRPSLGVSSLDWAAHYRAAFFSGA